MCLNDIDKRKKISLVSLCACSWISALEEHSVVQMNLRYNDLLIKQGDEFFTTMYNPDTIN